MLEDDEIIVFRNQDGYPYWTVIGRCRETGKLKIVGRFASLRVNNAFFVVRPNIVRYHAYVRGQGIFGEQMGALPLPSGAIRITYRPFERDKFFRELESGKRVDRAVEVLFREREVWVLNPRSI